MKFTPNQVVLDGGDRYEAGQEYDVPEDRVKHMVSHGWGAAPELGPVPQQSVPDRATLRPDDVNSASDAPHVGD